MTKNHIHRIRPAIQRSILIATFTALLCSNTTAKIFNFTTEEGYTNGDITDNPSWSGPAGCIVNATYGTLSIAVDQKPNLQYTEPFNGDPGTTHTLGIVFQFTRKEPYELPQNQISLFKLGFFRRAHPCGVWFSRTHKYGKKAYMLRIISKLKNSTSFASTDLIYTQQIHTDGSMESDPLYLEFNLKKGATKDKWQANATLYNLKKDPAKTNAVASISSDFSSSEEIFTNSNLSAHLISGKDTMDHFLERLTIDSFLIQTEQHELAAPKEKQPVLFPTADHLKINEPEDKAKRGRYKRQRKKTNKTNNTKDEPTSSPTTSNLYTRTETDRVEE